MKPQSLQESCKISQFLRENIVALGVAPLAVAGYAQRTDTGWSLVGGQSAPECLARPFDLASVSKSLCAVGLAHLISEAKLEWSTLLHDLLPELHGTWAGTQTIESHLSHRAGMLPHLELFLESWGGAPVVRDRLLHRAARARRKDWNGDALYSDLGYLLVGCGIERRFNCALDTLLAEKLFLPWKLQVGSSRAYFAHSPQFAQRAAATEIQLARGGVLQAVVHDDNAWALGGGGCCGHAGLFGTLEAVLRFGTRILDGQQSSLLEPLLRVRPGGSLRMGFDGVSETGSSAGIQAHSQTFGHLGFTGTSFWCDPVRQRVTALLSNRVHPTRQNPRIRTARPKMHDFLWMC